MKITVFGANGMLGYAVSEYFKRKGNEVVKVFRSDFDIAKEPHQRSEKFINNSDVVINCAGVIKPRIKDMTLEDVLKVNSIFPHNLAKICCEKNIKMIHITTDCVYTGNKGNYNEDDLFDADDIYGMTKNSGEPSNNCMVLRTSIIGEENGQSRSLLEWVKSQKGKEVNGYTNHLWNGVTTLYLAEIIEKTLTDNLYQKGLFHIHSPNTLNKYELVSTISEVYNLELKVNPIKVEIGCDRSMSSIYSISSRIAVKTIKEQLVEMRDFFGKLQI